MTNAMDFIDPANRLAVLEQVTAEGMLSLKKETIRGNEYHVFAEAPNNLREFFEIGLLHGCLLYTSPSPRDRYGSRMPASA